MNKHADAWRDHQRRRWMRHDAWRWERPGWPLPIEQEAKAALVRLPHAEAAPDPHLLDEVLREQSRLRIMLADIEFDRARNRYLARKFNPDQPRVPAGNPGGGQWTNGEGESGQSGNLDSFSSARGRGRSPAYCMTQYAVDGLLCNSVRPREKQASCWRQAAERLANCLSGRPIPPLNY